MPSIKLGELLVNANVLQESQLRAALAEQQKWGGRLGDIMVRMSLVTEDLLVRALSRQMGVPAINLETIQQITDQVKAKVPLQVARELEMVPIQLKEDGKTLVVAMAEPQNVGVVDSLRARTGCRIVTHLAGRTAIARAISRFYVGEAELSEADMGPFKVVDASGQPLVKNGHERANGRNGQAPAAADPTPRAGTPARPAAGAAAQDPIELLRTIEDIQRREVAALKAMVELLIDKGVFSREEYLAKVNR
ncbi:MAG TPA: hypothetical protein VE549_07725 [Myxococcaceae bacterium]|nr:hypothetical protein [Myxococcaceae bacterium]